MDIKTITSNQIECTIQDSTVQAMEHRLRHSLILHMNQNVKSHETKRYLSVYMYMVGGDDCADLKKHPTPVHISVLIIIYHALLM